MSGSFTLTGQLKHHDKVTPHVNAPLQFTAVAYPDSGDDVIYAQGVDLVTDADGSFEVDLLTETDLYYTVTSASNPALFDRFTFLAPADGTTVDLSELTTTSIGAVTPSVLVEALAARDAAIAAAESVAHYLEDHGAVGDGTTDDMTAINATLATMAPGDRLIPNPSKVYAHSGVINLTPKGIHVVGGTFKGLDSAHCAMYLIGDGVTVTNVTKNVAWTTRTNTQDSHSFVLTGASQILDHPTVNGAGGVGIFAFGATDYLIDAPRVLNTGADGIHNTYGSTRGRIRSPRVYLAGDDHLAFVSYTGDPAPVTDVTATDVICYCTGQTNGRGIAVVGGEDIKVDNYKVIDSWGASVYVNIETAFPTRAINRIRFNRGELIRPNVGWATTGPHHGAILLGNAAPTNGVDDVEVNDVIVRDAGTSMGTGAGRVITLQKTGAGPITNLHVDRVQIRGVLCANVLSNTSGGNADAVQNVDFGRLATASLPASASAVAGATYYDTTINAEGYCNGTTWVNYGVTTDPGYTELATDQPSVNTTLGALPGLNPAVAANAKYVVRGMISYEAINTSDIKLSFTVPASATLDWGGVGLGVSVTTGLVGSFTSAKITGGSNTGSYGGAALGSKQYVMLTGRLVTVGTAGTLQLNFAQVVTDAANPTTVFAGSWLRLERVA